MSSEATYFPHPLAQATDVSDTVQLASVDRKCVEQTSVAKNLKTPLHMPESPDELLMEEVRNGSKDALAQLFRTYARTVRNVAYRILRDESEADDLVQEVFIYLFEKAALFDPSKGSASSWIIQVAYHRALNRRQYPNQLRATRPALARL